MVNDKNIHRGCMKAFVYPNNYEIRGLSNQSSKSEQFYFMNFIP